MVRRTMAPVGLALYFGDEDRASLTRAFEEITCKRCRQLECDGYPCFDWELEAIAEREDSERWRPDADADEVAAMLGDNGVVIFVDPVTLDRAG